MQPEKIDLTSATISEDKMAQLRGVLPEVFHEGSINWDELRNALGDYVEEDPKNERFGLRWPGKSKLQQIINTPSVGTLVPMPEESEDWDETGNVIIEGDNLEVLKLLQKSYAGKVKMVYIDPPYNTGNDFVYPDKYASGIDTYLEFTGQRDDNGNILTSNSESSGRYHANWLNMMYPRLYLARNLLRQDGVIFVSIDDHEQSNLKKLCDELFGEGCVEQYVWDVREPGTMPKTAKRTVRKEHEYLVAIYRDPEAKALNKYVEMKHAEKEPWGNPDNDPRGDWMSGNMARGTSPGTGGIKSFVIVNPAGIAFDRNWSVTKEEYDDLLSDNRIFFANNGQGVPRIKVFQNEPAQSTQSSIFEGLQSSQAGAATLSELVGEGALDHPKPVSLIRRLSQIGASTRDDLILDFFAGSGTTGHAVMQQNAEDGGNRKYILIQLPEPMESKTLDDGAQLRNIADICRERVRRAGKKIASEHLDKSIDTGFRCYKLAPSNFKPWDGSNAPMLTSARQASFMPQTQQLTLEERLLQAANHLDPHASDTAVLTELLLKLGEELTVPVRLLTLAGKTVFDVDNNLRLVCLEREITLHVIREMAALEPAEVICLDASFPNDQTKVNAAQIVATQASHGEESIAFKVV